MAKRETPIPASPMQALVDDFGQLILEFADKAVFSLRAAGQGDDAEVAVALRAGLSVQAASMTNATSELMDAITDRQRSQIDMQATGSGGIEIVRAARATMSKSSAFSAGFIDLIEPIKKIIRLVLDLLGIELPKWIGKLLDLIDNILKLITGFFGREASQRAERAQSGMYRHLRDIYRTEAASLSRQGRGGSIAEDNAD